MQSTKLSLGVALLAQLAAGCVSLSTLQTARAVPEGELRPAVGVSVGSVSAPRSQTSLTLPVPEVGLRYGLGGGRDLGIKASPLGSQVEAKQELISSGGFVLALAPALAFEYFTNLAGVGESSSSTWLFAVQVPLLFGVDLPGGSELVVGPRFIEAVESNSGSGSSSNTKSFTLLGGSVGISFKAGQSLRVLPELTFVTKIAGDGDNGGSGFQFGVGFLFGK